MAKDYVPGFTDTFKKAFKEGKRLVLVTELASTAAEWAVNTAAPLQRPATVRSDIGFRLAIQIQSWGHSEAFGACGPN